MTKPIKEYLRFSSLVMVGCLAPFHQCFAQEERYCVEPVDVERVDASEPASRSAGPSEFRFVETAEVPIALDNVRVPVSSESYRLHRALWRFGQNHQLVGPYDLGGFEIVGSDGTTTFLKHGEYRTDTDAAQQSHDGREWVQSIYRLAPGGVPEKVEGPWSADGESLHIRNFDELLGGVVANIYSGGRDTRRSNNTVLVTADAIEPITSDLRSERVLRSARWNVDVVGSESNINLIHQDTGQLTQLHLPQAGANEIWRWESINIDRYGWLFAEGNGNDYAVKLQDDGETILAEKVYKYTGYEWFNRLLMWLFGMGRGDTPVDWTYHSNQCVSFSPALGLTLFCEPMKVLVDGELEDIGDGTAPLEAYVGDSTHLKVALFRGSDSGLYAYDGESTQLLDEGLGPFANVQDLPTRDQTFITAEGSAYRLTGEFPNLQLTSMTIDQPPVYAWNRDCCLNLIPRLSGTRFEPFPSSEDTLFFSTAHGVGTVRGSSVEIIWRPTYPPINLSTVSPVSVWDSTVFLTGGNLPYRVGRCEAEVPAS